MYEKHKLDLRAFGQAVKEARETKGLSREQLAEILKSLTVRPAIRSILKRGGNTQAYKNSMRS